MRPPAPSRDPCFWCEVPGFRGCAHQAPFDPVDVARPLRENAEDKPRRKPGARHYQTQARG